MIQPLKTEQDVRAAAHQLITNNTSMDNTAAIKQWLDESQTMTGEDQQVNVIANLLSMPDDQFAMLAPIFLEEMEQSYTDPATQLVMVQIYNLRGIKEEDLREEFSAIQDTIDGMADTLSAPKRDFLKKLLYLNFNTLAGAEGIAKRIINVPIELCHPNAKMPAYAHLTDAGMDIYALEDIIIGPGETKLISTGIKVALPAGYELQVRPKSGRCLKTKLRVANTPGTIDAGYRDEIGVIIDNIDPPIRNITSQAHLDTDGHLVQDPIGIGDIEFGQSYTIGKGEKFAQLVLSEVPRVAWYQVDSVANLGEDRGGGFGSSGLK